MSKRLLIVVSCLLFGVIGNGSVNASCHVYITNVANVYSIHLTADATHSGTLSAFSLAVRYPNTVTITPAITLSGVAFATNFSADLGAAASHPGYNIQGYQYADGSTTLNLTNVSDVVIGTITFTGGTSGIVDLVHETGLSGVAVTYIEYNSTTDVTATNPFPSGLTETISTNTWYYLRYSGVPLPVELVSLTASARGRNIDLSWSTKTETNNYGFDVERLNASSTWDKVGFVEGKGTTSAPQSYSYKDVVKSAGTVTYRLKQTDRDGKFTYSSQVEAKSMLSPEDYKLSQNYPNPFNPSTKLNFAVNASEQVTVRVFNNLGQEVKTLFNGVAQADQVYDVTFDGAGLSSGTYYYVLKAKDRFEVKKMVMMK